ncbi:hypothetical protein NX059_007197 [Plenodomus lindquistii]|nr:hypothetical protein NX059_007197 [Plenodomus lindquistii]
MRWASRYTHTHRIPASTTRAHASRDPTAYKPPLSSALVPKPTLDSSHASYNTSYLYPTPTATATMGSNSWNPFASPSSRRNSPTRRSGYARSYAGSSYSGTSRHHSSTSRYKRSPRDGYLTHLYKKFQHFLREIWRYAQRHPYKVFFAVIMPLVSGGVLHKLAKQFGITLPDFGGGRANTTSTSRGRYAGSGHSNTYYDNPNYSTGAGGYYGSSGYDSYSAPRGQANGGGGMMSGLGNIDMQSVAGGIGGLANLASMASKFM